MTRPRGMPLPPRAMSSPIDPVEMPRISWIEFAPRAMMAPLPNSFSIWARVFFNSLLWSAMFAPVNEGVGPPAAPTGRCIGRTFTVNKCYLTQPIGRAQGRQREFSAIVGEASTRKGGKIGLNAVLRFRLLRAAVSDY